MESKSENPPKDAAPAAKTSGEKPVQANEPVRFTDWAMI